MSCIKNLFYNNKNIHILLLCFYRFSVKIFNFNMFNYFYIGLQYKNSSLENSLIEKVQL